ncbi:MULTISPECIES: hypothetical protein [Halomicrobium]|uniref:DUF8123 domain-containing protein n=1 Tax=Halomicrobium mukohataei TaxID=57705 RepID=A0A847U733_9EURY|nr:MULTISPECIES: hypothetical protein [Halomicrobium]MBO4247486.1 hypothetical protein [Halomicrobium sp. IBSBa]NLV08789.1 hypothetical protein [Halomicrobium mukohataei]QGA84051.1 putative membrane protein [Halomicrobium sp. LC1Hm]
MNALTERFDDLAEPLGIGTGVVLVLIGLGTVAGTPWTTNGSLMVSVLQMLGVVATIALGVALASLSWNGR